VAKRKRRRRPREQAAPVDYADPDGNVLSLRTELSPGTIAKIADAGVKAGGSGEDAWQRRTELLFERLAVSWVVAGLPLRDQAMLLGRYRMASADERRWVQRTIAVHLERFIPELSDDWLPPARRRGPGR
jgi:hypothetical protein